MSDSYIGEFPAHVVPIHFDIIDHKIRLATFISTASDFEKVIEGINISVFDGALTYEIYVIPPESGSFKTKLKVVSITAGVLWAGMESEIGAGFISGLTGHEPAYWSEKIGKNTRGC